LHTQRHLHAQPSLTLHPRPSPEHKLPRRWGKERAGKAPAVHEHATNATSDSSTTPKLPHRVTRAHTQRHATSGSTTRPQVIFYCCVGVQRWGRSPSYDQQYPSSLRPAALRSCPRRSPRAPLPTPQRHVSRSHHEVPHRARRQSAGQALPQLRQHLRGHRRHDGQQLRRHGRAVRAHQRHLGHGRTHEPSLSLGPHTVNSSPPLGAGRRVRLGKDWRCGTAGQGPGSACGRRDAAQSRAEEPRRAPRRPPPRRAA
jgi:hypothetical protein